jgi:hypothetical protein
MTRCDENCYPLRPNTKAEHCKVCHLTFAGTNAGDSHRTGKHGVTKGPDRRRCHPAAELAALGMWTQGEGRMTVWHGVANPRGVQHRRDRPDYSTSPNLRA